MVEQKVCVGISPKLHFRPAEKLTGIAMEYHSRITIKSKNRETDAKSFLSMLAANLKFGDQIEIVCDGEDEKEALKRMVAFLENGE